MIEPLKQFIEQIKLKLSRFQWSFEWILIGALIIITSSVLYTAYLAYQSLVQLTEVVAQGSESEVKLLIIKSISSDLASAESNIKSYGLSKQKTYLSYYRKSIKNVDTEMAKLDTLILKDSKQQVIYDSIAFYVTQKIAYLKEFAQIQERGSVVKELNILTYQIEQNKKILAYYLGDQTKSKQTEDKLGFLRRLFGGKSIKKKEAEAKSSQQQESVNRLTEQIHMMEKVKGEIGKVKRRQGSTLKSIDEEELTITQKNKDISEKMNSFLVSLEMDELAHTRRIIEDIDKRHQKSDRLISVVSIMGALFLVLIGFVVISFIRKKNTYQLALLHAKNEAEQYSLLQERFLANMSHEIRTPMNAISGFTEQLLKTTLEDKQRSYLGIVQQSATYLLVIINDILDYARLKADKLTVESIVFSVEQVVTDSVNMLMNSAAAKGVSIKVKKEGTLPPKLLGDPIRLKQVLLNVLGNALKFTHKGTVEVILINKQTEDHRPIIQIQVKDTGIGISQQNLAKIFNAFEQAEVSTNRRFGGSGLGLSITQKLVELLNGSIQLESTEGKGTTVTLQFDWSAPTVGMASEPTALSEDSAKKYAVLKDKRILIADDEEWNTVLLSTILEAYGITLTIVKNGKDAVGKIKDQPYDLVLMDVRMPEMDGFEAASLIRKQSNIPIIGLTADMTEPQVKKCYVSGMNAVLGKPFTEMELCELINQTLQHPNQQYHPLPVDASPQKAASQPSTFSIRVLQEMSNGDTAFVQQMLSIFIKNGRESMSQMVEALKQKELNTIANHAHKMMPSVRQLDADRLLAGLKNIEKMANEKNIKSLGKLIEDMNTEFEGICASMQKTIDQLKK
jgi:signal transduction histidine kinase/DNA-binding response OmpR family regulator